MTQEKPIFGLVFGMVAHNPVLISGYWYTMYKGELISFAVAVSWTACALCAEVASKRMGALALNVIRMLMSLVMLAAVMLLFTGVPYPAGADSETWFWLSLSGLVGYLFGDFFLFSSYILIGSRYGQILMTLAPPAAAIAGWIMLGENMQWTAILGMLVTMAGITTAVYRKGGTSPEGRLSKRGILYGALAGIGQGVGLVLSAKGLESYELSVAAHGLDRDAMMPVMPFAATAIRALTGLVGFFLWTALSGELRSLARALGDGKGMLFALGATLTGPFIGVSLSLMATQYTATGIAQTIMALVPVMILLPTYLFFHQRITWRELLGSSIAVGGVAMFFI